MGESSPSYRSSRHLGLSPSLGSSITSQYATEIKIAIITISTVLIYFKDMYLIGSEALASNYYNYVVLIPFLSGYLIYRKRKVLSAVLPLRDETRFNINLAAGFGALVICIVLYMYGALTSSPEDYHLISLQIFLGASFLLLFNRQTLKLLLVPILLISTALPSAIEFGLSYWYQMAYLSAAPAVFLLKHVGLPVTFDVSNPVGPSIELRTSNGDVLSFIVSVASSGIYSLIGATVFFAFVGYIAMGSVWKKIALFLSAYPLLLVVNIVREVILVSAAYWWGEAAFNAFHATSGIVLVFILTFILLVVADRAFKLQIVPYRSVLKYCSVCSEQFRSKNRFCSNCGRFFGNLGNRLTSKDFFPVVAIGLMVLIFFSSLVPAVAVADAPTNTPLDSINATNAVYFLPQVSGWRLSYSGIDDVVMKALDADAALQFQYSATNNSQVFVNAEVQITSEVHIPQTSLISHCIAYGYTCTTFYVLPEDVVLLDNPPVVGQFMAFKYAQINPDPVALIYWQEPAVFNLGSTYDTRTVQVQLAADMVLLSQQGLVKNATDYKGAENLLLPLATATAKYWAPQGAISGLTVGLKKWGVVIMGVSVIPAVLMVGKDQLMSYRKFGQRRIKSNGSVLAKSAVIRSSLPEGMQSFLDCLHEIFEYSSNKKEDLTKGSMTLQEIASSYTRVTGSEISFADALTAMTYAEHLGIARKNVVDRLDEPVLVWSLSSVK